MVFFQDAGLEGLFYVAAGRQVLPHLGLGRQGIPQGNVEDGIQGQPAVRRGGAILGLRVRYLVFFKK